MLVQLRGSTESDLEIFFENQRDEEASYMAAFTSENHTDREAYLNKWTRLLKDPTITMKTILADKEIAGTVVKFEIDGEAEITYALGKNFWGKGIASKALQEFLPLEPMRPLFGRAAADNFGSIKVLEKCGFERIGTERNFAYARGKEIEEVIFRLV